MSDCTAPPLPLCNSTWGLAAESCPPVPTLQGPLRSPPQPNPTPQDHGRTQGLDSCSLGLEARFVRVQALSWGDAAPGGRLRDVGAEPECTDRRKRTVAALFQFYLLMKQDGVHFPLPHTSWAVRDEAQLIYLYCLWRRMPANVVRGLLSCCR